MNNRKVAVITGASRGIGRAVAGRFAAGGFDLALVSTNRNELQELARLLEMEYSISTIVLAGDLLDETFISYVTEETEKGFGRIDVLVNNAAWRTIETMRSMDLTTWDKTIRICLTAPAFLSKGAAAVMEKYNISGTIINISSVMSGRAGGYSPAYIACKGAIESLTYELAVTYGRQGIRVVCVQPGNIETDMSGDYTDAEGKSITNTVTAYMNDLTPLSRSGKPDEIAETIFWLGNSNASFITGTTILADGGFQHNFNSYSIKKLQFPREF